CLGLFEVACSAAEELRELLRAADLARHLVAQRPTAIARQAVLSHRTALDLLATHRLDGVAPDLDHCADAHASSAWSAQSRKERRALSLDLVGQARPELGEELTHVVRLGAPVVARDVEQPRHRRAVEGQAAGIDLARRREAADGRLDRRALPRTAGDHPLE